MSSAASVRALFVDVAPPDFPEDGPIADALEALVAGTLPAIPGLHDGLSADQRAQVMSTTIAAQREAFVARYGDPFGQPIDAVTPSTTHSIPASTHALRTAA